ncbi:MAG: Trk system potassium transporter TrkA [Spirochaetota bacterium]|nr:Trk system potassium transporter TrkA [Spirochaetota bacterium]
MNVIIIGAGSVGYQIAERLANDKHDVVIIDQDSEKIMEINKHLDVLTIVGKGGNFEVLSKAGIKECDILIAATDVDETNMIACFIAKKYNVPSKIARIREYHFDSYKNNKHKEFFDKNELGIDVYINPEEVATEKIINLINSPVAFEIVDFPDENLLIKGFRITDGLKVENKTIIEINQYKELNKMLVLAIIRNDEMIVPKGENKLLKNDKVYVIAKKNDFSEIAPLFHESYREIHNIFIIGISNITRKLCKFFEKEKIKIKVIEPDEKKCILLSEEFKKIDVVNCNPTDVELLMDEGLNEIDAFIAVSDDEEKNILSSMIAKKHNVRKTIAKLQNNDYIPFTSIMGIDAVINPKLATVGEILKYVRKKNVLSVVTLGESDAEVIEYLITGQNKLLDIPVKDIKISKGLFTFSYYKIR